MVDPKRVELTLYNGIPHLLTPVITDVPRTLNAFKWTVAEMERRYTILSKFGKRDIASYNAIAQEKMPYLVFIIDELSDIMLTAGRDVEAYIVRLTQMARAVGIHLIIATQRPSVNVITGLIKANIPARIAFSVASNVDSRTILDKAGAEKLLGKGDMLFQDPSESEPRRIQGVFVSDEEVKRAAIFLKQNLETPISYPDEIVNNENGHEINASDKTFGGVGDFEGDDPLYRQAVEIVMQTKKASASYLQRRLRIGFTRAARLIDIMEESGVVGPAQGAKPREILNDQVSSDIINK
jgi:S-DNA-T family DNA segregation ATPase FtsK/SpoIIIE